MKEPTITEIIQSIAKQKNLHIKEVSSGLIVNYLQQNYCLTSKGKIDTALMQRFLCENITLSKLLPLVFPEEETENIRKAGRKAVNNKSRFSYLEGIGINLSEQARNGEFLHLSFREEAMLLKTVLQKKQKSNALLIGPTRAGKSSLVQLLARECPEWEFFSISMAQILSGTKYRGMAEERMERIIKTAIEQNIILFFDEAHLLFSHSELKNQLKPYLSGSSSIRCIAATTTEESKLFKDDKAMMERFTTLNILPMKENELHVAMVNRGREICKNHNVQFSDGILLEAQRISEKLFGDTSLDNFIDIIDIACVLANNNSGKLEMNQLVLAASIQSGQNPSEIINLI